MKISENFKKAVNSRIYKERPSRHYENLFHCINNDEINYLEKVLELNENYEPLPCISQTFVDENKEVGKSISDLDDLKVQETLLKLIDKGNIAAIYCRGIMLYHNNDIEKTKEGINLILSAALKGYPDAQHFLANIYYDGKHKLANYFSLNNRYLSEFWDFLAAMNGHEEAQYWFADNCRLRKYDVDIIENRSWNDICKLYMISAEQGFSSAQVAIVNCLLNKFLPIFDFNKGIELAKHYYESGNKDIYDLLLRLDINPQKYGF